MQNKIINSILNDNLINAERFLKQKPGKFIPHQFMPLLALLKTAKFNDPPLNKLTTKLPEIINISTSYTCKLGCKMCDAGFQNRSFLFDDKKYLRPEEFNEIFPWIKSTSQVIFGGEGETLNTPYIVDFLKKTRDKVSIIVTSGFPLNEKRIRSLIRNKLNFLNLSFDGKSSIGHGGGSEKYINKFWKKVNKIQDLKKELKSKFPILCLQITVNSENIDTLDELFADARKSDVNNIIILPMMANSESLIKKSIFANFQISQKKINRAIAAWNKKGMNVGIMGLSRKLRNSITTCPYIDNYLDFHTEIDLPSVCCGPIRMPLKNSENSINKYWNSFPFRYLRYLHFYAEPKMFPAVCQSCWILNPKKYSEKCLSSKEDDSLKNYAFYREASKLKHDNKMDQSKEIFLKVLNLKPDFSLKGKTYFHLGEIKIMEKNFKEALSFMKLAVQYCFDHQKAFTYLYLLMALDNQNLRLDAQNPIRRKKKLHADFFKKIANNFPLTPPL